MIIIENGRIVDPANDIDTIANLYIDNGVIVGIGEQAIGDTSIDDMLQQADIEQTIDATDKIVCPGLIDLSVHLREPGQTHKATIESEANAAAASGITTLVCQPTTKPVIDSTAVAELIQDRAKACAKARILPIGALTVGLEGKQLAPMAALTSSGCIAFSNARATVENSQTLLRCLEYAKTHELLVIFNPQDNSLVANGVMHEGSTSSDMGLVGISEAAETIEVARSLLLIEQSGVRAHFGQISCERSINLISQARSNGLPVTADIAIHHLFFTDENAKGFNSMFHVQPPLRSQLDRAGLLNALVTDGIEAICSDHQPHEAAAKHAPFAATEPGISGLETLLPLGLQLVDQGLISLNQLIEKLTIGPAKILQIEAGSLQLGARADITIFDQSAHWLVDENSLTSAGKNSIFIGSTLKGKVTHTLLAGEVVHKLAQ